MPKWKSELIQVEKVVDGKTQPGVSVLIPLNDAAKASNYVDEATERGLYKPKDPKEKEKLQKLLKERMNKASKLRPIR